MDSYICYQCGGKGVYYWKYTDGTYFNSDNIKVVVRCTVCKGSGKINWLENIFRSNEIHFKGECGPIKINNEDENVKSNNY